MALLGLRSSISSTPLPLGTTALKVEGTSTTFGQNIVITSPVSENESPVLSQTPKATVSQLPPPVPAILESAIQESSIAPVDTPVVFEQNVSSLEETTNSSGDPFPLYGNSKLEIAVAAAGLTPTTPQRSTTASQTSPGSVQNVSPQYPLEGHAIVYGSILKDKKEQKRILSEAQKVDLSVALKSRRSESVVFNTLEEPQLEVDFFYNHFVGAEGSVEEQEDQSRDPLVKNRPYEVPRYIELKWNSTNVGVPLAGTEIEADKNKELRKGSFVVRGGVFGSDSSNFKDSSAKAEKNANPLQVDGKIKKLTDTHKIEEGFNTLANPKAFPNTVSIVVNTQEQDSVLSTIPYSSIKKI